MTLEYPEHGQWKALLPVLDDHTEWFHTFVKCLFYPEDPHLLESVKKPTSFAEWLVQANRQDGMQPEIIEKLSALHSDLFKTADTLLFNAKETASKPIYDNFQGFITIYEEFMHYVRRLEKEMLIDGSGFDSTTGLRNKAMLYNDITRELDRLERQGKQFSVALVKVDNYELIAQLPTPEEVRGYIKLVADLIKLSLRSFDDAYYMGKDEFVLCLKQADVTGGVSALERLRKELETQDVALKSASGEIVPLSVSCCIAEPLGDDNVEELIRNLRLDLQDTGYKKSDTVLEYHELSPLQRYMQEDSES